MAMMFSIKKEGAQKNKIILFKKKEGIDIVLI
jgi:hypothetical protein